jgi:tripartite-type tricarboxylate transporter receptor subunit TctC
MKRLFSSLLFSVVAVSLCGLCLPAWAQGYPHKPIKIIVPFGPGGFTDVAARILQKELAPAIGQPIIIEN